MRPSVLSMVVAGAIAAAVATFQRSNAAPPVPTQPMGTHMEITLRHARAPGDQQRADTIVVAAKRVMAQYPSVRDAERGGFKKFLPRIALPIEHYTNAAYAREAWSGHFDAMHPTSLIYERHGTDLALVGVMYTAPNGATEEDLNAAVPLSIGTWHRHVNFCVAPPDTPRDELVGPHARFYFGSIGTRSDCQAAHGLFVSRVFGWMVHVWPYEHDPAKVWVVDRHGSMSHDPMMHDMHDAMPGM